VPMAVSGVRNSWLALDVNSCSRRIRRSMRAC